MVSLPSKVVTIMFTLYGNYTHTCESMQGDYSHYKLSMLPAMHYYPTGQVNNDSSRASHEYHMEAGLNQVMRSLSGCGNYK